MKYAPARRSDIFINFLASTVAVFPIVAASRP